MSWTIERATMAERVFSGRYYLDRAYAGKDRAGRKRTIRAMIAAGEVEALPSGTGTRHRLTHKGLNAWQDFAARFRAATAGPSEKPQHHLGRVKS